MERRSWVIIPVEVCWEEKDKIAEQGEIRRISSERTAYFILYETEIFFRNHK
jgi:hypothetical protein